MRIAIFTDTFAPEINGVARTLGRLTEYLGRRNIQYQVFAPETSSSVPSVPQVKRFSSMPFLLYPECRLALPNPINLNQTLQRFNPTLIHIATPFNLGLYGLLYGKKHNIPMVASYHTHFDDYLSYYNLQFLQKWLWNYMRWFHRSLLKVYAPSISTKEKLLDQQIHQHIEVWGRGVNHLLYSPAKRSEQVRGKYSIKAKNIILYVGRIAPEKDIQIALDTFHALSAPVKKDSHLVIVGDGPLYKELAYQRQPNITFTGFLEGEELASLYATADVFLFPSSTETFGNVVLEALSSGLPVVCAEAGGVQHLVKHGVNGFLCHSRNTEDFIQATTTLLSHSELLSSFRIEARQFALTQSWDNVFSALIKSYFETQLTVSHTA
jgi:glycosyltransferase involved in cell wall biosynthesis